MDLAQVQGQSETPSYSLCSISILGLAKGDLHLSRLGVGEERDREGQGQRSVREEVKNE